MGCKGGAGERATQAGVSRVPRMRQCCKDLKKSHLGRMGNPLRHSLVPSRHGRKSEGRGEEGDGLAFVAREGI
jgi:hypothetical protein